MNAAADDDVRRNHESWEVPTSKLWAMGGSEFTFKIHKPRCTVTITIGLARIRIYSANCITLL